MSKKLKKPAAKRKPTASAARKMRDEATAEFLSQPPRHLPGGVYCSPWCGMGCKRADYVRAHDEGARFARKLGKGWTFEVWENCGWHMKLMKGKVDIHCNRPGFTAFLQTSPQFVSDSGHATPVDALRDVVAQVHLAIDTLTKEVGKVSADAL